MVKHRSESFQTFTEWQAMVKHSLEYILPVVFCLVWGGKSFVLIVFVEAALWIDFICVFMSSYLFKSSLKGHGVL